MSVATIGVEVLLAAGVGLAVISCFALLLMQDFYERLHYTTAVSTVSFFCVFIAIVVKEGWGQASIKSGLIFVIVLLTNAGLTHASARAARIRTYGTWSASPHRDVPIEEGLGEKLSEEARRRNEC